MDVFLIRATLAGLGLALAAAPLGCFVIWRRMAYFGDATGHAAILGVAIALSLEISIFAGVFATALAMALIVSHFAERQVSTDALLGVFAHGALALGLVAVTLTGKTSISLDSFLFGDILSVSWDDVRFIWLTALGVVALIGWRWQNLLTSTLSEDLATAAGLRPRVETLILTVAMALTVSAAIKVVGALLIASMLIIPAATARPLARTPEVMAVLTALVGAISVITGMVGAYWVDTQTGPSIIVAATLMFILSSLFGALRR